MSGCCLFEKVPGTVQNIASIALAASVSFLPIRQIGQPHQDAAKDSPSGLGHNVTRETRSNGN